VIRRRRSRDETASFPVSDWTLDQKRSAAKDGRNIDLVDESSTDSGKQVFRPRMVQNVKPSVSRPHTKFLVAGENAPGCVTTATLTGGGAL